MSDDEQRGEGARAEGARAEGARGRSIRSGEFYSGLGSVPIPDPTQRTTEALLREISALKELVFSRIDAQDRAIDLANENNARVPTQLDRAVQQLKDLNAEKFDAIRTQFEERDLRVSAALASAERAVEKQTQTFTTASDKSEAGTQKQIDQLAMLLQTAVAGLNDKNSDVKERVTRLEGQQIGTAESKADTHSSSVYTIAIVGVALAVISALIAAAALMHSFAVK